MNSIVKYSSLKKDVSLYPHQEEAVRFIQANRKGVLAHGTGLGKTLTSIASFERLKGAGGAKRALVIVPASLRNNYAENISKYTDSSYSVYGPQNEKNSLKLYDQSDSDYNIISYDMYKKDPVGIRERLGVDTLIVDEVHRARNEATGINKHLSSESGKYRNVISLTGSIVNNHPSDVSPLMDATLGENNNPIGSRSNFNRKYIKKRKGGFWSKSRGNGDTGINNRDALSRALRGRIHYVSRESVAKSLPPATLETIETPMTKEQKKLYLYAYGDLPPITKYKIRRNIPVSQKEMSSIFSKMIAARKVMTDPAAMDVNLSSGDPYEYSPKIRSVIDDLSKHLSDSSSNKVVVYGNLIGSQLDSVKKSLDRKGIPYATYFGTGNKGNSSQERDDGLKQYMSGKKRVLLISGAGGEGLDLKGSSMLQMIEGHYNPEKIHQAEARVRRMGDTPSKPIIIKRYVSTLPPNTLDKAMSIFGRKPPTSIDQYIYTVARKKDSLNSEFRDAISKSAGERMEKTAYNTSMHRSLMSMLKSKGVKLERAYSSMGPAVFLNSSGKPVRLFLPRGVDNPISKLLHEFGHINEPVFGPKINAFNETSRLGREIAANRSAANFILSSGGGRPGVRRFYEDISKNLKTYTDGVLKHTGKKIKINSPADAVAISEITGQSTSSIKRAISGSFAKHGEYMGKVAISMRGIERAARSRVLKVMGIANPDQRAYELHKTFKQLSRMQYGRGRSASIRDGVYNLANSISGDITLSPKTLKKVNQRQAILGRLVGEGTRGAGVNAGGDNPIQRLASSRKALKSIESVPAPLSKRLESYKTYIREHGKPNSDMITLYSAGSVEDLMAASKNPVSKIFTRAMEKEVMPGQLSYISRRGLFAGPSLESVSRYSSPGYTNSPNPGIMSFSIPKRYAIENGSGGQEFMIPRNVWHKAKNITVKHLTS